MNKTAVRARRTASIASIVNFVYALGIATIGTVVLVDLIKTGGLTTLQFISISLIFLFFTILFFMIAIGLLKKNKLAERGSFVVHLLVAGILVLQFFLDGGIMLVFLWTSLATAYLSHRIVRARRIL